MYLIKTYHIRLKGTEEELDNGFFILMNTGNWAITCLKNEEYIVSSEVIEILNKKKIKYELVIKNETV